MLNQNRSFWVRIRRSIAIVARLFDELFKACDVEKIKHSSSELENSISKEWGCERLAEQSVSTERSVPHWLVQAAEKQPESKPQTQASLPKLSLSTVDCGII